MKARTGPNVGCWGCDNPPIFLIQLLASFIHVHTNKVFMTKVFTAAKFYLFIYLLNLSTFRYI